MISELFQDTTLSVDDMTVLFGNKHSADDIVKLLKTFKKDPVRFWPLSSVMSVN